ncbi:ATP-binding protein [Algoriphagus zhangzhouensis]|uniref:Serine/threonine-protein kinase RsbW n=1 Tax=Algoriphagus zhangzhouensis TaxID=1073327 RepID=A0A1M7ZB68_9BACT|nr:ATP-binding protein [Algoriphagus zhangzhouensis]TDY46969.1 serine/threonine-protein kinase RsbW [Algoriphagus zhangzhouensis]SHO62072.1 serine/threonine-protein kinase RsbW [Algoriphagus zhangzhouensis]
MNSIKISIPSLIENIKIIESFIDNAREKFEINDDIYGNIMISVTECISNAIIHGNQSNKQKLVHLELKAEEDQLQFIIEDEGEGFEIESLPDPTAPENIEKPGGRGIYLIKNLTDEVKFEEGGKRTVLSFYMD